MARGRMLNNSVSLSLKFNQLPDDTCRLLATWTISHLDKNGVFYGLAVSVKSVVLPHRADITVEQVETYLRAMERVGLIIRFEAAGLMWQWWPTFTDNQVGLRADRESTSFPEPPANRPGPNGRPPAAPPDNPPPNPEHSRNNGGDIPEAFRQSAGNEPDAIPHKVKFKGESESKETLTDEDSARAGENIDDGLEVVSTCWETEIGFVNPLTADYLKDWLAEYPPDFVCEAIKEAKRCAKQHIRSPAYVQTVLDRLSRNQHPAVRVYCQKARRPEPIAELVETIIDAVGDAPEDLALLGQVIVGYKGMGWNVDNILNILEFFKRREVPQPNQNGRGNGNGNQNHSNGNRTNGRRIAVGITDAEARAEIANL